MTLFNLIIIISDIIALGIVYRLWMSSEMIVFKLIYSVLAFIPIFGPIMVILLANYGVRKFRGINVDLIINTFSKTPKLCSYLGILCLIISLMFSLNLVQESEIRTYFPGHSIIVSTISFLMSVLFFYCGFIGHRSHSGEPE